MALGTATIAEKTQILSAPVRMDLISFAGDGAYPGSGGTTGFQAYVRAALKAAGVVPNNVEVIGVIPQDCGGYVVVYDKAGDKLKVFDGNYDASDGPLQETATSNLSGVTFHLIVISK